VGSSQIMKYQNGLRKLTEQNTQKQENVTDSLPHDKCICEQ